MTWIAHVKRASAAPAPANDSTSDILLPRFPWSAERIGDSPSARVLVEEALPMLEAIVRYLDECSDPAQAAAAVRFYYDTPSIVKMLCFLFLQSYLPIVRRSGGALSRSISLWPRHHLAKHGLLGRHSPAQQQRQVLRRQYPALGRGLQLRQAVLRA